MRVQDINKRRMVGVGACRSRMDEGISRGWNSGPCVRDAPGDDKEHTADAQVGQQDVDPDVRGHGVQEGEEAGVGCVGLAVEDADAHSHEGLGEVHHLLPHVGDGEGGHGQVSPLRETEDHGTT